MVGWGVGVFYKVQDREVNGKTPRQPLPCEQMSVLF